MVRCTVTSFDVLACLFRMLTVLMVPMWLAATVVLMVVVVAVVMLTALGAGVATNEPPVPVASIMSVTASTEPEAMVMTWMISPGSKASMIEPYCLTHTATRSGCAGSMEP